MLSSPGSPLPPKYHLIFAIIEPLLTLSGAAYALLAPRLYHANLLPFEHVLLLGDPGGGARSTMAVAGLGSCFLLLAMMSAFLLPAVASALPHSPTAHERILRTYFLVLAFADILHVGVTLLHVPDQIFWQPGKWGTLLQGNIFITALLFVCRVSWLVGFGRFEFGPFHQIRRRDRMTPEEKAKDLADRNAREFEIIRLATEPKEHIPWE